MIKLYGRYFSKLFLSCWFVTTLSFVTLLSVVDSINNVDALPEDSGTMAALWYIVLRLPSIFDRVFMLSLFISLLLMYITLRRRNELVSFVAMGLSPFMQVKAFAPVVMLTTILSGIMIDQALPRTNSVLNNWLGSEALYDADFGDGSSFWVVSSDAFVEIGSIKGNMLYDVKLYSRSADSQIEAFTTAKTATYGDGSWHFDAPTTFQIKLPEREPIDSWTTRQTPETLQKLSDPPRNLAMHDLLVMSNLGTSGSRPVSAYLLWLVNRLMMPIQALAFVIIVAPFMHKFGRQEKDGKRLMIGASFGFLFFIIDGVLKTIAEGGGLSISFAIGAPLALILFLGIYMHLDRENVS